MDIELSELPTFFLAYLADPSSSSNIHSAVKQRFFAGEPAVVEGMAQFGLYTVEAKVRRGDWLCSCRHQPLPRVVPATLLRLTSSSSLSSSPSSSATGSSSAT